MHALLGRVRPVLEPHQLAVEQRVGPAGDVARRDDAGRGEARLVAHDAVVERRAPTTRASRSRARHRRPTTTTSASTVEPSASRTRSTRPSPSIASTCTPVRRSTPWSRCMSAITAPSSGPSPRTIGWGNASSTVTSSPRPRHVAATSAPMKPAPITTTRGEPRRARARERERVVERPQHEHAVEVGLVREPPRRRAGREHHPVERDPAPVRASVTSRAPTSSALAGEPSRQSTSRSSTPCLRRTMSSGSAVAGQQLLRERRPVVGQVRLGADRDDRAVEALAPQRFDRAQPRERRSHDGHRAHRADATNWLGT